MANITHDIVAKLWDLCNVLRDDGVTYHQYVTELTYLLFLKMAKETQVEEKLPYGYRWDDLETKPAPDRLAFYRELLVRLGTRGSGLVREIFDNASSFIRKPTTLSTLVTEIDKLDWYEAKKEGLGDLYEGLLEKNANEKKSGAGQYFTPRALIDSMVALMKPQRGDVIQDPAAGTGGFLISANRYIRDHEDFYSWTGAQQAQYTRSTFYGMELVHDTYRLALMNLMLHDLDSNSGEAGIHFGDTLSNQGKTLPKSSLILSNPPFGTKKGGGLPSRDDFTFPTSNKQLAFLQHIYRSLIEPRGDRPGGRAAVVLPDNVLFEGGVGAKVRADLMDKCNLHTILRLPTGIFYAQGVKTNVLFFSRGSKDKDSTQEVWVYDLRANTPPFGKRNSLTREFFAEFESAFGDDEYGSPDALAVRVDTGETGRFRRFSRDWISRRGNNLDISWMKEDGFDPASNADPVRLAQQAIDNLDLALIDLRILVKELNGEALE